VIGVVLPKRLFDRKDSQGNPITQDCVLRSLGASRRQRTGLLGACTRFLDGPRQYLVTGVKAVFAPSQGEERTLVVTSERGNDEFRREAQRGKNDLLHKSAPVVGKQFFFHGNEQITLNTEVLAMRAPVRGSPFYLALGTLGRTLAYDPHNANELRLWRSGTVCVPTHARLPWKHDDEPGIPLFRNSRLRKEEGLILAAHHYLHREEVEDIRNARLLQAKISDESREWIIRYQCERFTKRFAGTLHVVAVDYLETAKLTHEPTSQSFAYYAEADGFGTIMTVEQVEALLLENVDLERLEGIVQSGMLSRLGPISIPTESDTVPEVLQMPAKEIVLPQRAVGSTAFTSLREIQAYANHQVAAAG